MVNSYADESNRQFNRRREQLRDYGDAERRRTLKRISNNASERPHWIVGIAALFSIYALTLVIGFLANLFLQIPGCPAP